ncbi:MAG: CHRD domain-containing protein [Sporichthyaceae bacterium]|nr:CHRD domain-containing protein [Sporichthyaceae bacterium]
MATILAIGATTVAWSISSGTVGNTAHVTLSGYEEDPAVLSTTGNGHFQIHLDEAAQEISYELGYASLEGSVLQAHIHIGGRAQSGGISVFLCTNLGNGPAGTQLCPVAPATISGTIRPADVIGPAGQGISAGQFGELLAAIRAGKTYANVHSSLYQGGEIRAQVD